MYICGKWQDTEDTMSTTIKVLLFTVSFTKKNIDKAYGMISIFTNRTGILFVWLILRSLLVCNISFNINNGLYAKVMRTSWELVNNCWHRHTHLHTHTHTHTPTPTHTNTMTARPQYHNWRVTSHQLTDIKT